MSKTILHDGDEGVELIIREPRQRPARPSEKAAPARRSPVHVVYGGANLFNSGTARKLGDIALRALETYGPDAAAFGKALGLLGFEGIPLNAKTLHHLEKQFVDNPEAVRSGNYPFWLAATVRERVRRKLLSEPVEDLRIDFEDGYGFRPDAEEDADAERCAAELAGAFLEGSITPFSGFRTKAYGPETRDRARRTLNIFLDEFLELTKGKLPENFVVTLPKVTEKKEVAAFCRDLKKIEKMARIKEGSVRIELMVEHPLALIDRKGNFALRHIVEAARGRCVAAHFGAYDYTAALGIAALHQDIGHSACDFARQMMLIALSPLGIRLADSVTTQIPVGLHRGDKLSKRQITENAAAVAEGWRAHFGNIRRSMANGFYQSWDLHPNQLVARYAAVYSFFLEAAAGQAARLRSFIERATAATLTGHTFDDAASAMGIVNFFNQGLDSGAFSETEAAEFTGLSTAELRSGSFKKIIEGRG